MKSINLKYVMVFISFSSFFSCTKEVHEQLSSEKQNEIINFVVSVDNLSRIQTNGTSTSFKDNDAIGIFALSDQVEKHENVKYSYSEKKWVVSGSQPINSGSDFYSYYPYNEKATLDNILAGTCWNPQTDYLFSKGTITDVYLANGEKTVQFNFSHVMSYLEVKFLGSAADLLKDNEKSVRVVLTNVSVPESISIRSDNSIVKNADKKSNVLLEKNHESAYYAYIPPQEISSNSQFLRISVGNKTYEAKTGNKALSFEQGKLVSISINSIEGVND